MTIERIKMSMTLWRNTLLKRVQTLERNLFVVLLYFRIYFTLKFFGIAM